MTLDLSIFSKIYIKNLLNLTLLQTKNFIVFMPAEEALHSSMEFCQAYLKSSSDCPCAILISFISPSLFPSKGQKRTAKK